MKWEVLGDWDTPIEPTREDEAWLAGYALGLAQGEVKGRCDLAKELEQMFPEYKAPMDFEDAGRVRARQVH